MPLAEDDLLGRYNDPIHDRLRRHGRGLSGARYAAGTHELDQFLHARSRIVRRTAARTADGRAGPRRVRPALSIRRRGFERKGEFGRSA